MGTHTLLLRLAEKALGALWVLGDPQFLALSILPASARAGAVLNEGEGRGTFLIRQQRNIVNIGRALLEPAMQIL